ncbi:gephyrin-like molybdotransferase receptor GlpR [Nocardia sp. NPDC050406]|uniref:divisome protein SepX/GlpR n=1 Tax=Nocardia sp. NPDC050406 TaxID=3364318 RepID=UPI003789ED31
MPNSILWIGLVVLWVFVLFPMLAGRHPRIRQTTDAALATRVLHRGDTERRLWKRPAAGHETDPDYVPTRRVEHPHTDDAEDRMTKSDDETAKDDDDFTTDRDIDDRDRDTAAAEFDDDLEADLVDAAEYDEDTELVDDADLADDAEAIEGELDPDYAEVDSDGEIDDEFDSRTSDSDFEDEQEDPAAARDRTPLAARIPAARAHDLDDEGEFDADDPDFVPSRRGRGGYDPEADAIARAARYRFRQRAVLGLACSVVLFGAGGLLVSSSVWWLAALSAVVLGGYLAYLRKQVTIEEDIRRRRAARLARNRHRGDADDEEESPRRAAEPVRLDRESARTQLRRATLLESDDDDPMFEHLELFDAATARETRQRAAGGRMRRAVGE